MSDLISALMSGVPLIAFLACWSGFVLRGRSWRESFMLSAVLWGAWVFISTELLGALNAFTRGGLIGAWSAAAIAAITFAVRVSGRRCGPDAKLKLRASARKRFSGLTRFELALLAGVAAILAVVGFTAFVSPPNTWDAMEYTMPRIVMWLQHHNVSFYPTIDYQQLTMGPWADYAMAAFMALHRSDRLVNLVEWFSFGGVIVGASLIAEEFGASRRTQIFAAFLCATIPHAILAGSSAKPDVAVAFWILASVYLLLRWRRAPSFGEAAVAAAAVGLAILTKGTAFLLLPPLLLAVFFIWPGPVRRKFLVQIPAVALIALALNAPAFYRNYRLSGSPLGFSSPDGDQDVSGQRRFGNARHDPRAIAANVLRNAALHLETPSAAINARLERAFRLAIRALGQNPDDPAMIAGTKSGTAIAFTVPGASRSEVMAGNFFHFLLLLGAMAVVLLHPCVRREDLVLLSAGLAGSFVLFCAGLRWQPYNARFHLPLFAIGCALIAVVFLDRLPRTGRRAIGGQLRASERSAAAPALVALCAVLFLGAAPYALGNQMRPLVGTNFIHHSQDGYRSSILALPRSTLYLFDQHLSLADSYAQAAQAILASGCRSVSLDASMQHYEYPLFAMIRAGVGGPEVEYTDVHNRSAAYGVSDAPPCAVVCPGCGMIYQKYLAYGQTPDRALVFDRLSVFFYVEQINPDRPPPASDGLILAGAHPDSAPCSFLPPAVVAGTLEPGQAETAVKMSARADRQTSACVFETSTGRIAIRELPSKIPFYEIAKESLAPMQIHRPAFDATIVRDRGQPLAIYVHKDARIIEINLYRANSPVAPADLLHLAADLLVL